MSGSTIPGANAPIPAPTGGGSQVLRWDGTQWVLVSGPSNPLADTVPADAFFGGNGDNNRTGTNNPTFMNGRDGDDTLNGGGGNDILIGSGGADSILGGAGADTLIGADATVGGTLGNPSFTVSGVGAPDTLLGGTGDDVFIITEVTDSAVENGNEGLDTVLVAGGLTTYTLTSNVENLAPLNPATTAGLNLTGNDLDNSITGGAGADTLNGGNGSDTLSGGGGADSLVGGTGNDLLDGGADADTLIGGNQNDTLIGGDGNDRLDGGTDADSLVGGSGNNTLLGGNGNDTIISTSRADTIDAGADNDFVLLGPSGAANAQGGVGNDTLSFDFDGKITVTGAAGQQPGGNYVITGPNGFTTSIGGFENIRLADGRDVPLVPGHFVVCFASGTRILTSLGEKPVEALRSGDLVATVSGRGAPMKPVLWMGQRRITLAGNPQAEALAPVRIRAGALGEATPHRDLLVSPDHCLLLDGALVPARLLVNGTSIVVERDLAEVTYWHIELEAHDAVLAEGAAAESWMDCGNRHWFANADVAQMQVDALLESYGTGFDESRACAPLLHGGERLATIRHAIELRAMTPVAAPVPRQAAA
ncbi:Hint domain-containing protein [Falsiroseomonas oryziterrae]|uniref:Hint domain-containing protein n=1 Tax=Falsiroseomonas oryziterrae TaxID=2911368 RepID=UPI00235145C3|nr:Hint domain-containing protein [Roseomonas sp. NPKOSM-4]